MVRGASGDEWGELIGGKGTIGLLSAVPNKLHTRRLLYCNVTDKSSWGLTECDTEMKWENWCAMKHGLT